MDHGAAMHSASRALLAIPCGAHRQSFTPIIMNIIPVIDLKGGMVVHARRGERENYRALVTPYASSAEPMAVIEGLLAHFSFSDLYIADLDAIAGGVAHTEVVHAIATRHARLRLWLDAGVGTPAQLARLPALGNIDIVLGSESLAGIADYQTLCALLPAERRVLSLDRGTGHQPLGCAALFDASELWPARVIHMTLARVGSSGGPDFAGLANLRLRAPQCAVYAAGGVRDDDDLHALAAQGVAGALVATALHDGRITTTRR